MAKKPTTQKTIEAISHDEAKRKNIPTAEHQSVIGQEEKSLKQIKYPRNVDLDPQIVWRGKDEQDWSDLVINAPPLYIQEKVHPKALIDDLLRQTRSKEHDAGMITADLFADFDGIPKDVDKTEFYSHDQNWSNRMILGDSLQVMASLAEREGLRGQVQCIYFDPPYGIKFNSNFQWSTTSRDVKDGNSSHITREPEQVKAFRDTWRDGIHSYLTYLRDRMTVARDLLAESGAIFIQIGDENVHRVRALMDEIFGEENFVSEIILKKGGTATSNYLASVTDYILLYAKDKPRLKYRQLFSEKAVGVGGSTGERYDQIEEPNGIRRSMTKGEKANPSIIELSLKPFKQSNPCSQHDNPKHREIPLIFEGKSYFPPNDRQWSSNLEAMNRVIRSNRIMSTGKNLAYVMYADDYPVIPLNNIWTDALMRSTKTYVVETAPTVVERCLLMVTDPGDLVLDPTCGSGTTAYVSEQWARRWITIDTSRVALALARARIMGAKFGYYLLSDSRDGQIKEAEITNRAPSNNAVLGDIRQGFVYERVPHITLKSIANNQEIDVIWEKYEEKEGNLLGKLNKLLKKSHKIWEIPFSPPEDWSLDCKQALMEIINLRRTRQDEINRSIESKAEYEFLYDQPYEDKKRVRVSGPFTVESISPHRVLGVDENDELIDPKVKIDGAGIALQSFIQVILENLKISGVQQAHKTDRIEFTSITPWPGNLICAEGRYIEAASDSKVEKRAAIFIGPEFGTVQRADLVEAAREAGDAGFDALIACAFNYEAHASELNKLGSIPILKARMNADLHMAEDLKNTGKGNLFVIFGEPDIDVIEDVGDAIKIKINGVDVFKPQTGEVISDGADGIACWFVDTDYNEESFFVRQAYFLGANDPYSSLKTTLKAEINAEAWATLNSDTSRPFPKPKSGRIAVKVINHLGDEVMKVFKV